MSDETTEQRIDMAVADLSWQHRQSRDGRGVAYYEGYRDGMKAGVALGGDQLRDLRAAALAVVGNTHIECCFRTYESPYWRHDKDCAVGRLAALLEAP